jgi:hypothetical protein
VTFGHRGELGPHGWNLSPRGNNHPFIHPQRWTFPFRRMEGQTEKFTPRYNFTPKGQNSPLGEGVKICPEGRS